jgi:hypothetical protein
MGNEGEASHEALISLSPPRPGKVHTNELPTRGPFQRHKDKLLSWEPIFSILLDHPNVMGFLTALAKRTKISVASKTRGLRCVPADLNFQDLVRSSKSSLQILWLLLEDARLETKRRLGRHL